jgi:hypothetical protein
MNMNMCTHQAKNLVWAFTTHTSPIVHSNTDEDTT